MNFGGMEGFAEPWLLGGEGAAIEGDREDVATVVGGGALDINAASLAEASFDCKDCTLRVRLSIFVVIFFFSFMSLIGLVSTHVNMKGFAHVLKEPIIIFLNLLGLSSKHIVHPLKLVLKVRNHFLVLHVWFESINLATKGGGRLLVPRGLQCQLHLS